MGINRNITTKMQLGTKILVTKCQLLVYSVDRLISVLFSIWKFYGMGHNSANDGIDANYPDDWI